MDYKPTRYTQSDVSFIENEKWFFIHGSHLPSASGWKIYISYTPEFAESVLQIAVPLFVSNNLNFKYIKSAQELMALNSGQYGYSQIGKCLVVYAPDVNKYLVDKIASQLRGKIKAFPRPPYLAEISSDPPLFYRYGSYTYKNSSSALEDGQSIWRERSLVETRKIYISENEKSQAVIEYNEIDKLLLLYPVIDVISQQGKGGVFIAIDFSAEHYTEVIVKLGYCHGGEVQPGIDGIRLIRNDESILRFLESKPLHIIATPRVIAAAQGKYSYALVQEKINGKNSRELLVNGELTVKHINAIIDGIKNIHSHGLVWRDAKIDNVIVDQKTEQISFVDFETSTFLSEKNQRNCFKTFQIIEKNNFLPDVERDDLVHFLISVLFNPDLDDQKKICIQELVRRGYSDEVKRYCASMLDKYTENKTANRVAGGI